MGAFIDRIGVDVGRKLPAEDAVRWAARNGVRAIDCQLDLAPNALESFDRKRCHRLRSLAAEHEIAIALHTLSAVNVAEIAPFVSAAVDRYLDAYLDAAARIGADWVVVHAGYHFTADRERRMQAGFERLGRAARRAAEAGVRLLLENLNAEPEHAEVRYLAHDVAECRYYFDRLDSPALGWSFTVNHATLVPAGIDGFLDALPVERLGEVRLADNHGRYEEHQFPGDGVIDFGALFGRLDALGYRGRYTAAFGTLDDMLRGRALLASLRR